MAGVNKSAGGCDSRETDKGSLYPLLLSAASASLECGIQVIILSLCARILEQSLWINWHYTEEMRISFPSRCGPDSSHEGPFGIDVSSDLSVLLAMTSDGNERERKRHGLFSVWFMLVL